MKIQGIVCPFCNKPSQSTDLPTITHILKGGKVRCGDCSAEYWIFTPSDVLFLEAWGIEIELNYDFAEARKT